VIDEASIVGAALSPEEIRVRLAGGDGKPGSL